MDYQRIYNQLIQKALNETDQRIDAKKYGSYFEGHHIIPRCLGGKGRSDSWFKDLIQDRHCNIVGLTAREHYICHWLLTRIHVGNRKLNHSFWAMSLRLRKRGSIKVSSRAYAESKENISKYGFDDTHKKKIGLGNTGKVRSAETKQKLREANLGKKYVRSEEYRRNLSAASKGKPKERTPARIAVWAAKKGVPTGIPPTNKGIKHSIETIQKIKDSLSKIPNSMKDPVNVAKMVESRKRNREAKIAAGIIPKKPGRKISDVLENE